MDNQFIKRSTKSNIITASVISGIALISLIMIILLMQTNITNVAFFFSVALVFIITFWVGIIQIKVFNDHKSQRKYLCAEGIFIICLTILILITIGLFGFLQGDAVFSESGLENTFDIRWFIAIFLLGYAVWKTVVVALAIKEKRFNWWIELITAILWLAFSVLTIVSIFTVADFKTIQWCFVVCSWLLIIVYIVYLLVSYIFKRPTYLETPEAFELLKKDNNARNNRIARANAMLGNFGVEQPVEETPKAKDDLETKIKKLDELLAKKVLTKEEYDEKRKQIIKDYL